VIGVRRGRRRDRDAMTLSMIAIRSARKNGCRKIEFQKGPIFNLQSFSCAERVNASSFHSLIEV